MDLGIEGRTALVMGASRGLGRAIAARLAGEGARVAISSRSPEKLEQAAAEIEGELRAFPADTEDLKRLGELPDEVAHLRHFIASRRTVSHAHRSDADGGVPDQEYDVVAQSRRL